MIKDLVPAWVTRQWFHADLLTLTPQEWRIARLVAKGYSNAYIAKDLTIALKSVETNLSTIYSKVGVGCNDVSPRICLARMIWETEWVLAQLYGAETEPERQD